ncbi:MAG: hypothetical protein JXA69_06110 [Phycisphaerae bacterium]|nr:hypothetical protein [Phycisphaerae bacterium]
MIVTRMHKKRGCSGLVPGRLRGLAAVELLVVVVGVAAGASLLCSSLARMREGERTRVCLNTLKQMGYGVLEYAEDHAGTLPGPIHLTAPYNAAEVYLSQGPLGASFFRQQLTTFLAPYVAGRTEAQTVDAVPYCPSAAGIPVASSAGQAWYYQTRSFYMANTGAGAGYDPLSYPVKYKTDPPDYFGYINMGQDPSSPTFPDARRPKVLDAIANQATEWALADLWYWLAGASRGGSSSPVGTWPFAVSNAVSGSVSNYGKLKIPSYPFHCTTQTFSSDLNSPDRSIDSPRLTSGKTNAVFFDGHAASVGPWRGTVNPG